MHSGGSVAGAVGHAVQSIFQTDYEPFSFSINLAAAILAQALLADLKTLCELIVCDFGVLVVLGLLTTKLVSPLHHCTFHFVAVARRGFGPMVF